MAILLFDFFPLYIFMYQPTQEISILASNSSIYNAPSEPRDDQNVMKELAFCLNQE